MKLHGVTSKKKGKCHSREYRRPRLRDFSLFYGTGKKWTQNFDGEVGMKATTYNI
jgi:hypothetical protein